MKALATTLSFKIIGYGCKSVEIVQVSSVFYTLVVLSDWSFRKAALLLTNWPLAATSKTSEDNTWYAFPSQSVKLVMRVAQQSIPGFPGR